MALYQKIYVTGSTFYMESFILVSQRAQLSHYAALLMIGFVTWPPFFVPTLLSRWPNDKANHTCENML